MDTYSKVISKSSVSWVEVQKSLKATTQIKNFSVLKFFVKQCSDILIKNIKNLNQNQVWEQLESLSQSGHLGSIKTFFQKSKDSQNTLLAYLHSDDFYIEIPINSNGEIGDVKFAMFNEMQQSSNLLRNIFCSWNWDSLIKQIDGIKSMYVLADPCRTTRENAYKALKILENDLNIINNANKQFYKTIEKIIHESPIGLFKKSDIGHPMRLYYYLSPQDLILNDKNESNLMQDLNEETLLKYELGSYLTISLQNFKISKLPDISLLKQDLNIESKLLFDTNKQYKGFDVPGTFLITLNKPIVICINAIQELESHIGLKIIDSDEESKKISYFELLAKTVHGKILSDSYLVQLPDETHIYYITESKEYHAVEISKIPFTHPNHIQYVINVLRKQLLLNELSLSCMRKNCYTSGFKNARILEVSLISNSRLAVIMEHPTLFCYTTIEIDVSSGTILTTFRDHSNLHDPNIINEVFYRCHSIPVTIRALLMRYKQANLMLVDHSNQNGNASVQQQVYDTANDDLISNLTPTKQNSFFSQTLQFQTQNSYGQNNQSLFKDNNDESNYEDLFENAKSCSKLENNGDEEDDNMNDDDEEDDDDVDEDIKNIYLTEVNLPNDTVQDIQLTEDKGTVLNVPKISDESKVDPNNVNAKKRKASTCEMNVPFAKKKPVSESSEKNDDSKPKKPVIVESKSSTDLKSDMSISANKVPKPLVQSDLSNKNPSSKESSDVKKKPKPNSNTLQTKVSTKMPHSSSFNTQKQPNTTAPTTVSKSSSNAAISNLNTSDSKDKIINKDKTNVNKVIVKDGKTKPNTTLTTVTKKTDANTSNVNMKIKPITKDGLKIKISRDSMKMSHSASQLPLNNSGLNSSNSTDNIKYHNALNLSATNASTISTDNLSMHSNNSSLSLSKHASFNESLNEKNIDIILPKYEPKSKLEKSVSNTQLKRSISSAPTTPNNGDASNVNSALSLSSTGVKKKSITPPSCLELSSTPIAQVNKNKNNNNNNNNNNNTRPLNILTTKTSNNSIKSNFKIPHKSKTNQESTESNSSQSGSTNIQRSNSNQGSNMQSSIRKSESSSEINQKSSQNQNNSSNSNSISDNNSLNSFTTQISRKSSIQNDDESNYKVNGSNGSLSKDPNLIINTNSSSSNKTSSTTQSKQQSNSNFSKSLNKEKTYSTSSSGSSKMRISPNNNTSNLSPTSNSARPVTPIPSQNPISTFSQSFNRNSKNSNSMNDSNKSNRNSTVSLTSSNNNSSNSNSMNYTNSNITSYNPENQILMTPTSPSNTHDDISSKLTTIIPPDSPANNICETTTIPKLIPLERNNDERNNHDDLFIQQNQSDIKNQIKYKFEHSPEQNSLIIDLVSTDNAFLTPSCDKYENMFETMSNSKDFHQNSHIPYSKNNFQDVFDNDADLKVNL